MPLPLSRAVELLERIAPLAYAEEWDNVGLLLEPAGDRRDPSAAAAIARALLCVDLTPAVLAEAVARDVDLIVAYHPPLFRPLTRLRSGVPGERTVLDAARAGIALYSPHTALDAAPGGVNDWLAEGLGAGTSAPLLPGNPRVPAENKLVVFAPATHTGALRTALAEAGAGMIGEYVECSFELAGSGTFLGSAASNPSVGERGRLERVEEVRLEMICPAGALPRIAAAIRRVHPYEEPAWDVYPLVPRPRPGFGVGRSVTLSEPAPLATLVERLKAHTGRAGLRVAASPEHRAGGLVQRISVCAGSGGSVLARGPGHEVEVTGELSHHAVLASLARGASVILCEHSSSERGFLPVLAGRIAEAADGALDCLLAESDREPLELW
jgi:dinuclear metal center YbgI/SA1388 family protein